jgi:hypothetical protein
MNKALSEYLRPRLRWSGLSEHAVWSGVTRDVEQRARRSRSTLMNEIADLARRVGRTVPGEPDVIRFRSRLGGDASPYLNPSLAWSSACRVVRVTFLKTL